MLGWWVVCAACCHVAVVFAIMKLCLKKNVCPFLVWYQQILWNGHNKLDGMVTQ